MSVKKILLLAAAGAAAVSMTAAMAGGFTQEPSTSVAENGYYVEGHLGYANQNYFDNKNWAVVTQFRDHNNARGGFAAGVDAGYKINKHFAVELGWFHLPTVTLPSAFPFSTSSAAHLQSWALYLAGKYMMPLPWMNSTDMFFKFGVAYRDATISSSFGSFADTASNKSTFVRPMFATGLDYSFNDTWSGVMQYAYFMGANNSFPSATDRTNSFGTVAANVFTLGLAYKFTV
jgi:hypothetical protein